MTDMTTDVKKPAKGRGAKFVYDTLKREILSLELAPGTPLDETSLSNRFAMSRSPVREAIVRLSAEGLVDMLSNRSTLVAPIDLESFPRYVEALDYLQRVNTRLAARHRTAEDLHQMQSWAQAFDRAVEAGDYLEMSACNRSFHIAIAKGGKNSYLVSAYGKLLDEGRRILHMHFDYIQSSKQDKFLSSDHHDMIAAIRAQDVEEADRLAHAHTRQFHDRFINFLAARFDEDFSYDVKEVGG